MGRSRTKKLSDREMAVWISGYNKGLKAGLTAVAKGLKGISREQRVDRKNPKDVAAKFR